MLSSAANGVGGSNGIHQPATDSNNLIALDSRLFITAEPFGCRARFAAGHNGTLFKQGHVVKNWKQRYFVLERQELKYYTDEAKSSLKGAYVLNKRCTVTALSEQYDGRSNVLLVRAQRASDSSSSSHSSFGRNSAHSVTANNNSSISSSGKGVEELETLYMSAPSELDMKLWSEALLTAIHGGFANVLLPDIWPESFVPSLDLHVKHTYPSATPSSATAGGGGGDVLNEQQLSVTAEDGNVVSPVMTINEPLVTFNSIRNLTAFAASSNKASSSTSVPIEDQFCTLLMVDIDHPARGDEQRRSRLHWLVVNIYMGDLQQSNCVFNYQPPAPACFSELHRYFFVLFAQSNVLPAESIDEYRSFALSHFDDFPLISWTQQRFNAQPPVAVNGYYAKWHAVCDELHSRIGYTPPAEYLSTRQSRQLSIEVSKTLFFSSSSDTIASTAAAAGCGNSSLLRGVVNTNDDLSPTLASFRSGFDRTPATAAATTTVDEPRVASPVLLKSHSVKVSKRSRAIIKSKQAANTTTATATAVTTTSTSTTTSTTEEKADDIISYDDNRSKQTLPALKQPAESETTADDLEAIIVTAAATTAASTTAAATTATATTATIAVPTSPHDVGDGIAAVSYDDNSNTDNLMLEAQLPTVDEMINSSSSVAVFETTAGDSESNGADNFDFGPIHSSGRRGSGSSTYSSTSSNQGQHSINNNKVLLASRSVSPIPGRPPIGSRGTSADTSHASVANSSSSFSNSNSSSGGSNVMPMSPDSIGTIGSPRDTLFDSPPGSDSKEFNSHNSNSNSNDMNFHSSSNNINSNYSRNEEQRGLSRPYSTESMCSERTTDSSVYSYNSSTLLSPGGSSNLHSILRVKTAAGVSIPPIITDRAPQLGDSFYLGSEASLSPKASARDRHNSSGNSRLSWDVPSRNVDRDISTSSSVSTNASKKKLKPHSILKRTKSDIKKNVSFSLPADHHDNISSAELYDFGMALDFEMDDIPDYEIPIESKTRSENLREQQQHIQRAVMVVRSETDTTSATAAAEVDKAVASAPVAAVAATVAAVAPVSNGRADATTSEALKGVSAKTRRIEVSDSNSSNSSSSSAAAVDGDSYRLSSPTGASCSEKDGDEQLMKVSRTSSFDTNSSGLTMDDLSSIDASERRASVSSTPLSICSADGSDTNAAMNSSKDSSPRNAGIAALIASDSEDETNKASAIKVTIDRVHPPAVTSIAATTSSSLNGIAATGTTNSGTGSKGTNITNSGTSSGKSSSNSTPPRASATATPDALMERVLKAESTTELCIVFGIGSRTVFEGEIMKKKFSQDFRSKDRYIWVEPHTKSIHWSKNASEKHLTSKYKHFLLDRNSPFKSQKLNNPRKWSRRFSQQSAAGGSRPLSVESTGSGEHFFTTSAAAATSLGAQSDSEKDDVSSSAADSPLPVVTSIDVDTATAAAADEEEVAAATPAAAGTMEGVISSVQLSGLTLKLSTEAGETLQLTLPSGNNAEKRAQDWLKVLIFLTSES